MIDHGENPIRVTVGEGIVDKIHTSPFPWTDRHGSGSPMQRPVFSPPYLHPQLEPIQAIPAPDPFAIDRPTFPPQQDPDAQIAESGAGLREIGNAQPQGRLIFRLTLPIPRRATKTRPSDRPAHHSSEMSHEITGSVPGGGRASDFFSKGLRQHMFVEREVGHQPFESGVLLFHLPQSAEFAHAQMPILLLPGIEGGLADTQLLAEITNRGATLSLSDGIHDLLFGES